MEAFYFSKCFEAKHYVLKHLKNKHPAKYEDIQEKVIQNVMLRSYEDDPHKIRAQTQYHNYQYLKSTSSQKFLVLAMPTVAEAGTKEIKIVTPTEAMEVEMTEDRVVAEMRTDRRGGMEVGEGEAIEIWISLREIKGRAT